MTTRDDHRCQWMADGFGLVLGSARTALAGATAALLGGDGAEDGVKDAGRALHRMLGQIEDLEPVNAPPGTRAAVALAHLGGDLGSLAALTRQIAETAWTHRDRGPAPRSALSALEVLGRSTVDLVGRAGASATMEPAAAVAAARELEAELGTLTEQQRRLDAALVAHAPPVDRCSAVTLALLGRCYEGCARHAVSAARHVAARCVPEP